MRVFDLEAAKAGAPVCTDLSEPVRILCFDRKSSQFPIIALIDKGDNSESFVTFTKEGKESYSIGATALMMRDDNYAKKLARGEYGPTVKEKLTVDTPTCKDSLPVDRVACRREFAEKVMLKIIDGIVCHGGKNLDDNGSIYSSAAYDAVAYTDALLAELQTKKTEK
jgi:hypothetical protein